MKEQTRVFEVRKTIIREDIKSERLIFDLKKDEKTGNEEWVYQAPNAQTHTQAQLEQILQKIKELNV